MNYSEVISALDSATGFDLFRIKSAIARMLDDPARIIELKRNLIVGQEVEYFEPEENRVIRAKVLSFKRTRVSVQNIEDGSRWTIPYYYINIHQVDTSVSNDARNSGLDRNEVKVGDLVGFKDKNNQELYGRVIRLNQKTVTLECDAGSWRVSYGLLFKILGPDVDALPGN